MATNASGTLNPDFYFHTSNTGQLLDFSQAHFDHINSQLSDNDGSLTLNIKSPNRRPEAVTFRVRTSSAESLELRRIKAFLGCLLYEGNNSQTREIERVHRQFKSSPAVSELYCTSLDSPHTEKIHGVTLKTGYCTLKRVLEDIQEMPKCNLIAIEAEGIMFHDWVNPKEREKECKKTYRLLDNFIPDLRKFKSDNPTMKIILMSQNGGYLSSPEFRSYRSECISLFDAELRIKNTEQLKACLLNTFDSKGKTINASVIAFNEPVILRLVNELSSIRLTSTSGDKPVEVGCAYQYVANLEEQYNVLALQQSSKTLEEFFRNNTELKFQYDTWRYSKDKIGVVE